MAELTYEVDVDEDNMDEYVEAMEKEYDGNAEEEAEEDGDASEDPETSEPTLISHKFFKQSARLSNFIINKALMPFDVETYYDDIVTQKEKRNFYNTIGMIHLKHMTKIGSTTQIIKLLMIFILSYIAVVISLVYGTSYIYQNYGLSIIKEYRKRFPAKTTPVDFIKSSAFDESEKSTFQKLIDTVTEIIGNFIPDFTKIHEKIASVCSNNVGTLIFTVSLFKVFVLFGNFSNHYNNMYFLMISVFAILFIYIYINHINIQYDPVRQKLNLLMMSLLMLMFTFKGSVEWIHRQFMTWLVNSSQEGDELETIMRNCADKNSDFKKMLNMVRETGTKVKSVPQLLATGLRKVTLNSDPKNRTMTSGSSISSLQTTNYDNNETENSLALTILKGFQKIITNFDFSSLSDRFANKIKLSNE
jgi:hypothetical protein